MTFVAYSWYFNVKCGILSVVLWVSKKFDAVMKFQWWWIATRVVYYMPLVELELNTLSKHMSSPWVFVEYVLLSLSFCVVFCRSIIVCPFTFGLVLIACTSIRVKVRACRIRYIFPGRLIQHWVSYTTGVTSRAGTAHPPRVHHSPYFTPGFGWVHVARYLAFCVVFLEIVVYPCVFFLWP